MRAFCSDNCGQRHNPVRTRTPQTRCTWSLEPPARRYEGHGNKHKFSSPLCVLKILNIIGGMYLGLFSVRETKEGDDARCISLKSSTSGDRKRVPLNHVAW